METSRLIIREMSVADLDDLYGIYDENVTKYVESLYEDRKEEEEFTSAYIKNMYGYYGYGLWILQLKDGTIIGRAGLSNRMVDGEIKLEAGYLVGSSFQGNGYAFEAMSYIIGYAFDELESEEINCFIKEDNVPSKKLAEKLGFKNSGMVRCDEVEYIRYIKYKEKV